VAGAVWKVNIRVKSVSIKCLSSFAHMDIAALRQEYMRAGLDERDLAPDPLAQFNAWFDEALRSGLALPNAMTLATATKAGRPSARAVLLKGCDARGFVFYTNYLSRKGRELADNPQAMLLFCWTALERQVAIEGRVGKVSTAESDEYFASRPLGSRLSATVSPQSEPVADRAMLESALEEAARRWRDSPPRPVHWGGYRLIPEQFEFWQGRQDRLHDRLCYRKAGEGWEIERLAP
jgi:pyridoxamine 5'-phosphate oxidase